MKRWIVVVLIQHNLGHIEFLEFNRAKEAIVEGYKEGRGQIKKFSVKG